MTTTVRLLGSLVLRASHPHRNAPAHTVTITTVHPDGTLSFRTTTMGGRG